MFPVGSAPLRATGEALLVLYYNYKYLQFAGVRALKEVVEALLILIAALTVMLFFGPIIVILSVVGRLEIGSIKIDLSQVKRSGRVVVGIIGMIVWLAVYIPLIFLASRVFVGSPSTIFPPMTPTAMLTVAGMTTPAITSTPTLEPQATPTPSPPLVSLAGTYTGTFFTNSTKFFGTYTMTLTIFEDGTGMLLVPKAPFYEDNTISVQILDEKTVLVIFNDKEGDRIEARLIKEDDSLRGFWRYATGNPQHTATGKINVKKVK